MGKMKITTNNHWRGFKGAHEVPKEVLAWYDWLDENSNQSGWIQYKGHWTHVSDYLAVHNEVHNPNPPDWLAEWDGYDGNTIIRLATEGDEYQIGFSTEVNDG